MLKRIRIPSTKNWLNAYLLVADLSQRRSSNPRVIDRNSESLPRSCVNRRALSNISEADAASGQRTPACRLRMIKRQLDPVSAQAANFGIALDEHLSSAKGKSRMALHRFRFAHVARFHALQRAIVDLQPGNCQSRQRIHRAIQAMIGSTTALIPTRDGVASDIGLAVPLSMKL